MSDSVTVRKTTLQWLVVVVVVLVVGFGLGRFTAPAGTPTGDSVLAPTQPTQPTQAQPTQPTQPTQPPAPTQPTRLDVSEDDDAFKGDPNAPVTIIEFSDYECPFCSRFYTQTLPQLESEYIDTGKVKLVYRDFPLSFHPNAQKAAEAAECAGEQGNYWDFHDKIFENQRALSIDNYKQWAADFGLDTAQFNDCLDSDKYATEVQEDMAAGSAAGVSGTPSFIINGQRLVGAQPFSAFKAIIDAELAAA